MKGIKKKKINIKKLKKIKTMKIKHKTIKQRNKEEGLQKEDKYFKDTIICFNKKN